MLEDLADLYGVETRRLVEQVKRNLDRFPEDFMFQLNKAEAEALRSVAVASAQRRVYGHGTPNRWRNPMAAEVKNFDSPDETRPFEGNGQAKVVQLAGHAVAEGTFEPGWKWSENVKPIAGTDSCQVAHFGYVLSGSMRIFMDDGTEAELNAGDVFAIPPGHDAEVPGPEACVMVDFGEIGDYAKRN